MILYQEILPEWMRYTEQFPLAITDIIMRDKDWVELRPRIPDRDALLCPSFFKNARKGGQTFKGGKALVHFHIPNNVYAAYEACLEEREYQNLILDESQIDHGVSLRDSQSSESNCRPRSQLDTNHEGQQHKRKETSSYKIAT